MCVFYSNQATGDDSTRWEMFCCVHVHRVCVCVSGQVWTQGTISDFPGPLQEYNGRRNCFNGKRLMWDAHTHTRVHVHTWTHRLSKSLKLVRGRKREDIITYTWKNRDGGERIDSEERVGAALLPLSSCFHPLESVVFQNTGIDSRVKMQLMLFFL